MPKPSEMGSEKGAPRVGLVGISERSKSQTMLAWLCLSVYPNSRIDIEQFMTAALKTLAKTVVQLPAKDRAFLAERLLDSLHDAELEEAWIDAAKRRRDEVRSGKVKPIAAKQVYKKIEALLGK